MDKLEFNSTNEKDRIGKLFSISSEADGDSNDPSSSREMPKMFAVPPPSALLSRLQAFLPEIQKANESLSQTKDLSSLNIESVEEGAQHIEMDLGLGVFEPKILDGSDASSEEDHDAEDEDFSDEDEGEEEEEEKEEEGKNNTTVPSFLKITSPTVTKKRKPGIVELDDTTTTDAAEKMEE